MAWSDLPDHINEPHEWDGKDDDKHWYTAWRKYVKGWFAFSFGRRVPRVLIAACNQTGYWRLEHDFEGTEFQDARFLWLPRFTEGWYLSRVQYLADWHIALQ